MKKGEDENVNQIANVGDDTARPSVRLILSILLSYFLQKHMSSANIRTIYLDTKSQHRTFQISSLSVNKRKFSDYKEKSQDDITTKC